MKILGNGHSLCFGLLLNECYATETFCNVVLRCTPENSNLNEVFILRANGSVLAATFPVFRSLLEGRGSEGADICITLAGYKHAEVSNLVHFGYTGIVSNSRNPEVSKIFQEFGVDLKNLRMEEGITQATANSTSHEIINNGNIATNNSQSPEFSSQSMGTKNGGILQSSPAAGSNVKTREDLGRFPCKICGRIFKYSSALEAHVLGHVPSGRTMQCQKCGTSFLNAGSFTYHQRNCNSKNPHSYKCEFCNSGFANRNSLRRHIKRYHTMAVDVEIPKLACESVQRDRPATQERTRQEPEQKVDTDVLTSDEGEFKCSLCPRKFSTLSESEAHLNLHASAGLVFECDVCSSAFESKQRLSRHQVKHRLDFECSTCSVIFKSLAEKRDHDASHHMEVETEEIV